jgi:hypothetical protein
MKLATAGSEIDEVEEEKEDDDEEDVFDNFLDISTD